MSDDAKKKDEGEAKPKKSKKLLIIILAAVLLAGGGGGAAWFFLMKPKADATAEDEEEHKPPPKDKAKVKTFANLEPFTVNLADEGGERFVQVSVVLEVADAKVSTDLTAQMPAVRNAVLMLLSSKYAKDLLTVPGKEQLAEEIAIAAGRELGWEPPEDDEDRPSKRKAKADAQEAEPKADAKGADKGADKKAKKRKKRRADPNPIEAVHFAQFIVQ